jgi:hypothetical protein
MKGTRPSATSRRPRPLASFLLTVAVVLLALVVAYLGYGFISRHVLRPPVDSTKEGGAVQVEILNGCGVSGAATAFTGYLRARGFDVVEMRNFKTFDVQHSLIIDRTGNRRLAEQVAQALGVSRDHVIQQINTDYFVDVSVVIGRDYLSLQPSPSGDNR